MSADAEVGTPPFTEMQLQEANRAYDAAHCRAPQQADVVRTLDAQLKVVGYQVIGSSRPGQTICFQGKVYKVLAGQKVKTIGLLATGVVAGQVTTTFSRVANDLADLYVRTADGQRTVINGTAGHPFYVPAVKQFVHMGTLAIGSVLQTSGGSPVTVIGRKKQAGAFRVYNLEVAGEHDYYILKNFILVHNACGDLLDNIFNQPWAKPGAMKCDQVARAIKNALGEEATIVKLVDKYDAPVMKLKDGTIIGTEGWHEVVEFQGRYYDSITGKDGATWKDYIQMFDPQTGN